MKQDQPPATTPLKPGWMLKYLALADRRRKKTESVQAAFVAARGGGGIFGLVPCAFCGGLHRKQIGCPNVELADAR